jgi:hypothetical protein
MVYSRALPSSRRFRWCMALAVLALFCFGCGRGEPRGQVTGKVTFQDKPVTEGYVRLSNKEKGIHITADLKSDGAYEVKMAKRAGVPIGSYQVCVCPPPIQPKGVFDSMKVKPYPNIPKKYRDTATSGISLTVNEGANTLNIDMKP